MPDILADWEIEAEKTAQWKLKQPQQQHSLPHPYLQHLWDELWELPPPVDEDKLEVSDSADATATITTTANATFEPSADVLPNLKAEFSHRDWVFLQGRKARESPPLSFSLAVVVSVQFLLSLIIGFSVLVLSGKSGSSHNACDESGAWMNATSPATAAGDVTSACAAVAGGTTGAVQLVSLTAQGRETQQICMAIVCIACVLSLQCIKFYYK